MPKFRAKTETPTKAPDTVMARMLAKLLGVAQDDGGDRVIESYMDNGTNRELILLLGSVSYAAWAYPWLTDVARDVMSDHTTPLTEHVVSTPGTAVIVKDSARQGADSLWLLIADPDPARFAALITLEHRGLTRVFRLPDGDLSHVIAIQLTSCKP